MNKKKLNGLENSLEISSMFLKAAEEVKQANAERESVTRQKRLPQLIGGAGKRLLMKHMQSIAETIPRPTASAGKRQRKYGPA